MRIDRDWLIFILLVVAVILLNVAPLAPAIKLPVFVVIVILQVLFVYHGLKRHRS